MHIQYIYISSYTSIYIDVYTYHHIHLSKKKGDYISEKCIKIVLF